MRLTSSHVYYDRFNYDHLCVVPTALGAAMQKRERGQELVGEDGRGLERRAEKWNK